jgi:hypothetical protein
LKNSEVGIEELLHRKGASHIHSSVNQCQESTALLIFPLVARRLPNFFQ